MGYCRVIIANICRSLFFLIKFNLFFCYSYGNCNTASLVPLDSSNFVIVNDSLIDIYSFFELNTLSEFNKANTVEVLKQNPCEIQKGIGIASFRASSVFKKSNKCFYIYKIGSSYFINVGIVYEYYHIDSVFRWRFNESKINLNRINLLIQNLKTEVNSAKITTYKSWDDFPVRSNRVSFVFADIQNNKYAITPRASYSNSVIKLIRRSKRLVNRKL